MMSHQFDEDAMLTRRHFIAASASVAGAATAAGGAAALSIEPVTEEVRQSLQAACVPRQYHDTLREEIAAILGEIDRPKFDEATAQRLRDGVPCRFCGRLVSPDC